VRPIGRLALRWLALPAVAALTLGAATARAEDLAARWELVMQESSSLHEIELSLPVYEASSASDLSDLVVLDGEGRRMPWSFFPLPDPPPEVRVVPFTAIDVVATEVAPIATPPAAAPTPADVSVRVQGAGEALVVVRSEGAVRDRDGGSRPLVEGAEETVVDPSSVRAVNGDSPPTGGAAPLRIEGAGWAKTLEPQLAWSLGPFSGERKPRVLTFDWQSRRTPRAWWRLSWIDGSGAVVNAGQPGVLPVSGTGVAGAMQIAVPQGPHSQALRLDLFGSLPGFALRAVSAETPAEARAVEVLGAIAMERLQGPEGLQRLEKTGRENRVPGDFHYRLLGPVEVRSLELAAGPGGPAAGIHAVEFWGRAASDQAWRWLAGGDWVRLAVPGGPVEKSHWPAGPERVREIALATRPALSGPPTLRVAWRPDRVAFLAAGKPPYSLAVLKAPDRVAQETDLVETAVREVRQRLGAAWRPLPARLGAAMIPIRLEPPSGASPIWRVIGLWSALILGTVVVLTLMLRVLAKSGEGG